MPVHRPLPMFLLPASLACAGILACSGATQAPTPVAPSTAPAPAVAPAPGAVAPPVVIAGAAIDRIRQRGELLVGMDTGEPEGAGTPPMFFSDDKGQPDGFDYRVAEWIATTVGVPKVRLVHAKYSELPAMLTEKAQFDVIVSGYVAAEKPGISWSEGYLDFGLCLVVPSKSEVKTTADLWGKAIGIFDDDDAANHVTTLAKGFTELVRMEDGYWDALLAGKFSAFIYDYPYTVAELRDYYEEHPDKKGAFRIAQYNLTDSQYSVGVRTGEPELMGAVNEAIHRFQASDAYRDAIRKYLSGGAAVAPPKDGGRVYVVLKGDTLSGIAAKELGGAGKWRDIWNLNKSRFPNPNLIEVGDEVVLPS